MKKRLFVFLMISLAIGRLNAQDLIIHKTDGTIITIILNEIDSITFIESGGDFVCGVSTLTDIDGNIYNTVLIGDQCWMKENLKTARDASGNNITRYCYDNNTTNCEIYGGLYSWQTLMNGSGSSNGNPSGVQGICPTGWHIPSNAEWGQLIDYFVSQGFPNSEVSNGAGNALKSCRQVNSPIGGECNTTVHPRWDSHSTHFGFDEFGFSALPGGQTSGNTSESIGKYGGWWSATESSSTYAWRCFTNSWYGKIYRDSAIAKTYKFSVRCIKD
jgi:uncharacterized protein (TIGR02145 family)